MIRSAARATTVVLLLSSFSVTTAGAAELTVNTLSPARSSMAAANTTVTVTFDRAVDRPSVDSSSFRVFGRGSGTASGSFSYSSGDTVVTFTPSEPFSAGELVTVNLSHDLVAADSSPMRSAGYAFQFLIQVEPSLRSFDVVDVFSNRTNPGTSTRIYGAAASDLNNDDFLDLATVNEDSGDVRVFLNNADGSGTFGPFLAPEPIGFEASPNEPADFDNDGNTDLCVSAAATENAWIMLGQGDGTFGTPQSISLGSQPHGIAPLDVDGDGDWDIAGANVGSNDLSLMINNGSGSFGAPTFFEGGVDGEYGLVAADMNNDGIMDLVVGGRNGEDINVMLGNGNGTFTVAGPAQDSGGLTWVVVTGDVDGDGNLDASTANSFTDGGNGAILLGSGDGTFEPPQVISVGSHIPSTDLGDMDGDGDLDLVLSSYGGGFWRMYTNDGAGNFMFDQQFDALSNPSCAILYDADNDGDLDMALTDEIADVVVLMENENASACTPTPASCRSAEPGKSRLLIRDSGDGEKDRITWKWSKGEATSTTEFGDPISVEDYALCIYDNNAPILGAEIPSGNDWSGIGGGYKYGDSDQLPDGITNVLFKAGALDGDTRVKVVGKGGFLGPPDLSTISGPLDVQLQRADGAICFGATFSTPFDLHDLTQLKATSD